MLPWLLLGFGCWLSYQLVRQNGRILLRLEALESKPEPIGAPDDTKPGSTQAPAPSAGLPAGSMAPAFELPDLDGTQRGLAEFRGRRVLLVFFSPHCGFCTAMMPDLAALASGGGNRRPMPLVVTTGDAETNRLLFQKHGVRYPVLLQETLQGTGEVAAQYQAQGTPMGYLIDEQGAIASGLTAGAADLLAMANAKGNPSLVNQSLANSRLNRSGLKAGTPAPGFRLSRLGGGDLALDEYRGRRVLLVFSDPKCGPCDQLAPRLEQLHRHRHGFQVLMVSRQDAETNRRKVAQLGLTFPVALQKNWEVSLLYAMFATPMGYLIDERGIIAADIAIGAQPILDLVSGTADSNSAVSKTGHLQEQDSVSVH
ncbi:MAG TPA: redoxin domain-containing protein [Candidatus Acidoferrales bacterium]|nr:redoxin domain-containing protein [Candidatus Acidoferrales bacterium]